MSQRLNDLANGVFITGMNSAPALAITTTGITGPPIDMITADGNCFAIQVVGTIIGVTAVFNGKIQECPNTTAASFTDVSGATFPTVTTVGTSGPLVQVITYQRTQRFVRYVGVLSGVTCSVVADALSLEQNKNFGA